MLRVLPLKGEFPAEIGDDPAGTTSTNRQEKNMGSRIRWNGIVFFILFCMVFGTVGVQIAGAETDSEQPAATATTDDNERVKLKGITVTSTSPGREESIEDVQASVQVITQEQIQSISMRSVSQALDYAAGIHATDTGSNAAISIRGFHQYNTLILIDGMRSTGYFHRSNVNSIPIGNVEKIEIIRGPMSALYGADASAGVVNIITKRSSDKMKGSATLHAGTSDIGDRNSLIGRASLDTGKVGSTYHRLSAEVKDRDELQLDPAASADLPSNEHYFLNYRGGWDIDANRSMKWSAEYQRQRDIHNFVYYGFIEGGHDQERFHLSANYNDKNDSRIIDLSVGYGESESDVNLGADEHYLHDIGEANGFLTLFPLNNLILTLGTGGRFEKADATSFEEERERNVYHVLGQFDWEIVPDLNLVAGIRHEDFNDFGQSTNPRITLGYTPGQFHFRVGYGQGFRAPLYHEMYRALVRGVTLTKGNPDLEPEETETFEAAAGYRFDRGSLEIVYHHSDIDNLIETVRGTPTASDLAKYGYLSAISQYQNVAEAKIQGIEATVQATPFFFWDVCLTYAYLDAKDAQTDERLESRARHALKILNTFHLHEKLDMYANIRFYRDYLGTAASYGYSGPVESFDYEDICLKLVYRFNNRLEFFSGIDNVLQDTDNPLAKPDPCVRYYYAGLTCSF